MYTPGTQSVVNRRRRAVHSHNPQHTENGVSDHVGELKEGTQKPVLALSMWTPGTHSVVSRRGVQSSVTTSGTRTCRAKSVSAMTSSRNLAWQRAS